MTVEPALFPLPASKKGNSNLMAYARKKKRDEFYTRSDEIVDEVLAIHEACPDFFKGKRIYCNCDDPKQSMFYKFFHLMSPRLQIANLTTTHLNFFGKSYVLSYDPKTDKETRTELEGNGDFRSEECQRILEQCDVVVTNPPFSLFLPYFYQLMESGKHFLIVANINAITHKNFFHWFKEGRFRFGFHRGGMKFNIPDEYFLEEYKKGDDGEKIIPISTARWFTNIEHGFVPPPIDLEHEYRPEDYPKYKNCNAIEVGRTKQIPKDYDGAMGVPITFLDKFNPEQFEILDCLMHLTVGEEVRYWRVVIQHKGKPPVDLDYWLPSKRKEEIAKMEGFDYD